MTASTIPLRGRPLPACFDGTTGQMGVKNIVSYLNSRSIFTRDGGRWGIGQVHRILTRRTCMGEHEFNKRSKTKELKPVSEGTTGAERLRGHGRADGKAGRSGRRSP